ncbi:hypothetical protein GYA25_03345 [Candidatus Woesearchaeota archaeon]|jgi:hypothetical protein|nr:hypothetical protein [Candidatus Woesearchaeota archaeon]
MEELFKKENIFKIEEYERYKNKLRNTLNSYSDSLLKEKLNEMLENKEEKPRLEERIMIEELKTRKNGKYNEDIANFYEDIYSIKKYNPKQEEFKRDISNTFNMMFNLKKDKNVNVEEIVIKSICLGLNLLYNQKIDKRELFLLERVIDNLPFNEIRIENTQRFQKFYSKFKEYCMNRYLEDFD